MQSRPLPASAVEVTDLSAATLAETDNRVRFAEGTHPPTPPHDASVADSFKQTEARPDIHPPAHQGIPQPLRHDPKSRPTPVPPPPPSQKIGPASPRNRPSNTPQCDALVADSLKQNRSSFPADDTNVDFGRPNRPRHFNPAPNHQPIREVPGRSATTQRADRPPCRHSHGAQHSRSLRCVARPSTTQCDYLVADSFKQHRGARTAAGPRPGDNPGGMGAYSTVKPSEVSACAAAISSTSRIG